MIVWFLIKLKILSLTALINIILITVVLLFIADYVLVMSDYFPESIIFTLQTLFRTIALSFLAYGGTRIAGK